MSTDGDGRLTAGGYWLLDTETANMIGYYETEMAALRDVLDTVERYGRTSRAALSLALAADGTDGVEDDALVGEALIERALTRLVPGSEPAPSSASAPVTR
jgi:hypothetical protein